MDCIASIFVKGDFDKISECFGSEEKDFDRSQYTIHRKDDGIQFEIVSNDAVALRATLSAITQLLAIYEGVLKTEEK